MPEINAGDTAWLLTSCALVLFMTPGLAFFYAGMVRAKNVINMLVLNYVVAGIIGLVWVLIGYSLAFGDDVGGWGIIGNLQFAGLQNLDDPIPGFAAMTIPAILFVSFQTKFAVITPALFSGSIAERMKFSAFLVILILWSILVYAPIAHWIFSPNGFLYELGALDFAGGAVVHMNAGIAGLVLAILVGRRSGWPKHEPAAHNVPFILLGTALLWFGWFGFNAGSALSAGTLASYAFLNTNTAAAGAMLAWIITERLRGGRANGLGVASGTIAGLVAITPAAGFVDPLGSMIIGILAGILTNFACSLKYRFGYDDALDVLGVHFVGGLVGALAIGLFASTAVNSGATDGLFYGGGLALLGKQALSTLIVVAYSFVMTFLIGLAVKKTMGLRVSESEERIGLDLTQHGEIAYDNGERDKTAATTEEEERQRIATQSQQRTGAHGTSV